MSIVKSRHYVFATMVNCSFWISLLMLGFTFCGTQIRAQELMFTENSQFTITANLLKSSRNVLVGHFNILRQNIVDLAGVSEEFQIPLTVILHNTPVYCSIPINVTDDSPGVSDVVKINFLINQTIFACSANQSSYYMSSSSASQADLQEDNVKLLLGNGRNLCIKDFTLQGQLVHCDKTSLQDVNEAKLPSNTWDFGQLATTDVLCACLLGNETVAGNQSEMTTQFGTRFSPASNVTFENETSFSTDAFEIFTNFTTRFKNVTDIGPEATVDVSNSTDFENATGIFVTGIGTSLTDTTTQVVTISTTLRDVCQPNPCMHGGNCTSNGLNSACMCARGYEGSNCEVVNPCIVSSPCKHEGACSWDSANRQFSCKCSSPFTGATCDAVDCTLCQAPKLCNLDRGCFCPPHRFGRDCQFVDYCSLDNAPCQNGAGCSRMYFCEACKDPTGCAAERNGRLNATCDADFCESSSCPTIALPYTCSCIGQFTGANCTDNPNPCAPLTCKNGGQCIATNRTCACQAGWEGEMCDIASTVPLMTTTALSVVATSAAQGAGRSDTGAIVGGVLGALAAIGLIVAAIFLVKYVRRMRKLKGKYNPAKEEIAHGSGPPLQMTPIDKEERLI